jgi:hypothetical protein
MHQPQHIGLGQALIGCLWVAAEDLLEGDAG